MNLSKRFHAIAGIILLISVFSMACRKQTVNPDSETNNNGNVAKGDITQVGTAIGEEEQKSIGPNGGSFTTSDNKITIEFPAGALSKETTIRVQSISNFCPGAAGNAYRISPHLILNKPATITFNYSNSDIGGSSAILLAVAYQNEQQVWETAKIVEKDTANKKITVSTTHFSDWSLFRSLELNPDALRLNLGESRNLFVRRVIPVSSPDELEVPTPGTFLSAQEASNEIRDWRLIGAGAIDPQGAKAVYTAPSSVPDWTPVVNVRLKNTPGNMELTLVCNITILWEGARWRVDGGQWITGRSPGAVLVSGVSSVRLHADKNATETILIDWKHNLSLPADYPWILNDFPSFTYTLSGPFYLHIYPVKPDVGAPSPGSLRITEYDARPGGYVAGTFTLDKAAKYNVCPTCPATIHKIEGSFRVKWAGE